MADDETIAWANAKRALTRQVNRIKQSLAENEIDNYTNEVSKLKSLFNEFTDTHEKYCDVKAAELDIDTCDKYYEKEQYKYIKVLEQVKDFNQQNATAGKNESFSSKS